MKLQLADMMHDEFELYFARAALVKDLDESNEGRRGSLPNACLNIPVQDDNSMHRRAASCKYPSRRKSRRKSRSRTPSRSPMRRESQEPSQYVPPSTLGQETLRAPSPRLDIKSHSAPHSRSSSWKNMRRPRSTRDLQAMERKGSVPLEEAVTAKLEQLRFLQAEDCCVVRNFSTSKKGFVNRGDSFKRKSSTNICGAPEASEMKPVEMPKPERPTKSAPVTWITHEGQIYKVLVLGDHGVGKTALLQQFMTSEYMGAVETSFDEDYEKTVSVLIDNNETMLNFADVPSGQNYMSFGEVDAYILVYSITDRASFLFARDMLLAIRRQEDKHAAVIMVANKSDLVRSRQILEEEAKELCTEFEYKYIEVSAALNHKVDDLLFGIVKQILLSPERTHRTQLRRADSTRDTDCVQSAKGLLHKLFKRQANISRSCDNLLVL